MSAGACSRRATTSSALLICTFVQIIPARGLFTQRPAQPALDDPAAASQSFVDHLLGRLWKGADLNRRENELLDRFVLSPLRFSGPIALPSVPEDAEHQEVQLLGPPDSGTNLIVKTIQLNWPDRVLGDGGALDRLVWKHSVSNASDLTSRFEEKLGERFHSTVIIEVVRNPISQLDGWRWDPHSLAPCMLRSWQDMDLPCFANTSPDWHDITPGVDVYQWYPNKSINFKSSWDVYNRYLQQYRDLQAQSAQFVLLRYEDVVLTPEAAFAEVARALRWPMPAEFRTLDNPSLPSGHTRDLALQKIKQRTYLREMTAEDLALACAGINRSLVSDLSEGSFTAEPVPYLQDCRAPAEAAGPPP